MNKSPQELSFEEEIHLAVSMPQPPDEFVRKLEGQLSVLSYREERQAHPRPALRLAAWFALAALLILALVFVTPQGRALAQNIVHFFTRSNSNGRPVQTPTTQPLVEVTSGVPLPTLSATLSRPLAFAQQCGDINIPTCTLSQIRTLVSFPVKALSIDPAFTSLRFVGATGGSDQLWLVYRSEDLTQVLFLIEGPKVAEGFIGEKIAANAIIENVQVGAASAEYVKGGWGSVLVNGELMWDVSIPIQSLRWMDGDLYYEIDAMANPDKLTFWATKSGLLSLANSLDLKPEAPTPEPSNDFLTLSEAEALAGFHVVAPDKLPREYSFNQASYSPLSKTVCLIYKQPGDSFAYLSIAESASTPLPDLSKLFPAGANGSQIDTTLMNIGGALDGQGTLVKGNLNANQFCVSKLMGPGGEWTHQDEVLRFETQGLKVSIYAKSSPDMNWQLFITRQELVKLAEGITGVHTVPDSQPDPEYLTSIQDAEAIAGFRIQLPTQLHADDVFEFFSVTNENDSRRVAAYYHSTYNFMAIYATSHPTETLDSIINGSQRYISPDWEGWKKVTVHGQPAIMEVNPGAEIVIIWFENGIEYRLFAIYDGQPTYTWLAIAESMQ
jgi:hypothetical protein